MQRDEGSGSGYGPDFNPDGDEDDESRGSGSGAHDIEPGNYTNTPFTYCLSHCKHIAWKLLLITRHILA